MSESSNGELPPGHPSPGDKSGGCPFTSMTNGNAKTEDLKKSD